MPKPCFLCISQNEGGNDMYYGKMMRKVWSVVLSAAMLFSSASVPMVHADESPGITAAPGIVAEPGEGMKISTMPTKAVTGSPSVIKAGDDVELKFNFGEGSPQNFILVNNNTAYDEKLGYGISNYVGTYNKAGVNSYAGFANETDTELKTAVSKIGFYQNTDEAEMEFSVDLEAGSYKIQVYAGGVDKNASYRNNMIYVNVGDENSDTGQPAKVGNRDVYETAAGIICSEKDIVLDKDSIIKIKASNTNSGNTPRAFINAVVITGTVSTPTEYTVSYDLQGGSGSISDTATYKLKDEITLSTVKPTKANSVFLGWALKPNGTKDDLVTSVVANRANAGEDDVINLYAIWIEETKYKVQYVIDNTAGEEGTAPVDTKEYMVTDVVTLADTTGIAKNGYICDGWALVQNSTTKLESYTVDAKNADANKVIKFYPVWIKAYKLAYDVNGGTGTIEDNGSYKAGEKISLKDGSTLKKEGYNFIGWALSKDSKTAFSSYTLKETDANATTNTITLYAVWQAEGVVSQKYDFGKKVGEAEGYTLITAATTYDSTKGYGIVSTKGSEKDVGKSAGLKASSGYEALLEACSDSVVFDNGTNGSLLEFKADVPAGRYEVKVWAGGFSDNATYQANTIYVNDKEVGTSAGRLGNNSSVEYTVDSNTYVLSRIVTVGDKEGIVVRAETKSGAAGRAFIDAIEIKSSTAAAFSAPENVKVNSTATSVTLTWDAVQDATHYAVFRHSPSGDDAHSDTYNQDFLQIGSTADTTFTDPVLTDKVYEYYVIAVGSRDGETIEVSDPSKTVENTVVGQTGMGTAAPAETYADRALVAATTEEGVFVSWRLYESDCKDGTKKNDSTIFTLTRNGEEVYKGLKTNFLDKAGKAGDRYTLTASKGISTGGESTVAWSREYQEFNLQAPDSQTMPDGSIAEYTSNDMSVGDLDGDGQLELIVKWYPSNAKDNSQDGYTGTTILDGYDIDIATGKAELMWRVDLGLNIRSGAHYTQYQVWDFNGDGKAEIICKTADGTTTYNSSLAETGHVGEVSMAQLDISKEDQDYDYRYIAYDKNGNRTRLGRIVDGPEYLTAFDGETGEIIDTVNYVPFRGPYDEKTQKWDTSHWGHKGSGLAEKNDGYANRADRFLSGTAYIDGGSAAAIFSRGYYDRTAITAWKLINDELVMQWTFDAPDQSEYAGQGNHGLSINDVDNDGYDEIVFAGLVVNNNGVPLANTHWGHGDAMHVSDWNGDGKLEVYKVNEEHWGAGVYDPATGEVLWFEEGSGDTGRGVAGDIDPRYEGAEMWHSIDFHTHDVNGNIIYEQKPSQNFTIFWDGDLLTEMFDSNNSKDLVPQVQKWNYEEIAQEVLLQADGTQLNNGTKGNAGLVADIYGDWREEFIVRDAQNNNKIRLYTTTIETDYSFPCLLEDRAYREGVAWQNVAYNQPANVTYLLSEGLKTAVITDADRTTNTVTLHWEAASDGTYGNEVIGYRVYRALSADAPISDYVLVGEVDGQTLEFTDTELTANTEYTYIVEAVINDVIGYKSLPFSAKTAITAAGVQNPEPITLVQDAEDYESKFPVTVVVVDEAGKEQDVDITWDYSTLQISEVGEKTVYGTIYGREEKVPIQVTVVANKITAVEELDDIYTLVGQEVELPTEVVLKMYNKVDQTVAVNWQKNYDVNVKGTYEVTGTCESSYHEEATVKVTVHVVDDYVVSVEEPVGIEVDFESDAAGKMPATVKATFAKDGRTEDVPVKWSYVDTSILGTVEVTGTVENFAGYAVILVKVDYPIVERFDFGITTSPVEEGWIGIQVEQGGSKSVDELGIGYTAEKGYGFLEGSSKMIGRNQTGYDKRGVYPKSVYADLLIPANATESNTFVLDVENGEYVVEMISGSSDSNTIKTEIEGKAFSVHNDANTYEVGRFEGIKVTDGQLTMVFPASGVARVSAVIVHKVVEGSSSSQEPVEKLENMVNSLPDADQKLSSYDVTRIDKAAELITEMGPEDWNEISEETIEKLDELYKKAHNLSLEVVVEAPEDVEADKVLADGSVTAKGVLTASGAEEGLVSLEITQQKPTKEPANSQIEFKAELKVNAERQDLKAPILITIELPEGIDTNNMQIKHYTNSGTLKETFTKGSSANGRNYVLNGRTVTFRVNSFSIFSFVTRKSGGGSNSGGSGSSSSNRPSTVIVPSIGGKWVKDNTGWWYNYNNGGYPANKWEKIQNKWYYFEATGYMKTGWVQTNNIWYYCKEDGSMADTEWIVSNGHWYYLNAGGPMATGWIVYKDKWYYLNPDGSMKTGWIQYNDKWYFLKADGDMAVNETTPDGYQVDQNGVWIQ